MENKLTPEVALKFVEHIQKHLDAGDRGLKLYKIPSGVVGCAICGKSIWEIAGEKDGI